MRFTVERGAWLWQVFSSKVWLLPLLLIGCLTQASELESEWQPATESQLDAALTQFAEVAREGRFVQQKWFRFLKRPVTSSGFYQQQPGEQPQVIWHTEQPLFNKLEITPTQVRQQKEPEGDWQLLSRDVELAKLLYAVVSGDLRHYQQILWFSGQNGCLKGELTESQWHQFVAEMVLCLTNEQQASLELVDSKSTRTLIQLNRSVQP